MLGGKADQAVPLHPWKGAPEDARSGQSDEHAFTG